MCIEYLKKLLDKDKDKDKVMRVKDWPYNYILQAAYITTYDTKYSPIQDEILEALNSHCSTCEAKLISILFKNGTTQACPNCHNIDEISALKHTNIH